MRTPHTPPEIRSWTMSDGYAIAGRLWPPSPDARPPAALIYVHGIQSHGGWFEWSAALLARTGNPVLLPDRRGSGLNRQDRGDTPSAERWLADIDELASWLETRYAIERLDVVGVSWGGKLAVAWALRNSERVGRLLLVAPGVFPAVDVGIIGRIRVGLALLTGGLRRFPIPLDDPGLFTDNPAGQAFIRNDPLKLTHATARFLYQSSKLDRQLGRAAPGALRVPVTLALATRDRIIRNSRTERWLRRLVAQPVTVRVFPAAHTLEFEESVATFEDFIRQWAGGGS
jgi:alpha-beta hydrolase superfamily lysophospholipase